MAGLYTKRKMPKMLIAMIVHNLCVSLLTFLTSNYLCFWEINLLKFFGQKHFNYFLGSEACAKKYAQIGIATVRMQSVI